MTELKPCPFCGSEAKYHDSSCAEEICEYVSCLKCNAQSPLMYRKGEEVEWWNRRPSLWHTGTPTEAWRYLTKVKVRDCDGSYFFMYEAVWFDGEEWVNRKHQQPVFAWQKIDEGEVND